MRYLIAVDGSDFARAAVRLVTSLADTMPKADCIYVLPRRGPSGDWNSLSGPPSFLTESQEFLRAAGVPSETFVLPEGLSIARTICQTAERTGADWIVVGSHGQRGFHRMILGSVSRGVLRISTVPVLVVPLPVVRDGAGAILPSLSVGADS